MIQTINEPEIVTARKEHVCDWCGGKISVGERYSCGVFKIDDIYSWKNHLKCGELVSVLKMKGDYGVSGTDFEGYIKEEFNEICIETGNRNGFVNPCFLDMVDFVYKHRCKKDGGL